MVRAVACARTGADEGGSRAVRETDEHDFIRFDWQDRCRDRRQPGTWPNLGRALARAGADLVITSRHLPDLKSFQDEIEGIGRKVLPLELDVPNVDGIGRAAESTWSHFGKIDILVNNAGCNVRKPALEITPDDWDLVLETNLRGSFFVAQAFARHMVKRGYGRTFVSGARPRSGLPLRPSAPGKTRPER